MSDHSEEGHEPFDLWAGELDSDDPRLAEAARISAERRADLQAVL